MGFVHMSEGSVQALLDRRRETGLGRLDECWEGVWHLTDPTARHQEISGRVYRVHAEVVEDAGKGTVWISINVTDRELEWIDNHRCPDGAVILKGNAGRWIGENRAAFLGGPDLVLEVRSEGDETLQKLPFYASLGVREILLLDQQSGEGEFFRADAGGFRQVSLPAVSEVTGLEYFPGKSGLEVRDPATGRIWKI